MNDSSAPDSLAALIAERDVLVLSPHMDDAMLSASSVVLDHPCEVWTVFTGAPRPPQTTSWDLSCGFSDSDATVRARLLEDDTAFAGVAASNRRLGYLEGAYASREQRRLELVDIEGALQAWMDQHPYGLVVAPVCAGRHMPPAPWTSMVERGRRLLNGLKGRRPLATASHEGVHKNLGDSTGVNPPRRDAQPAAVAGASHAVARLSAGGRRILRSGVQRALHAEYLHRRAKAMDGGLAANPDHLVLRDLALDVAVRHPGVRIAFYEDFPYLWHARGDAEMARLRHGRGLEADRVVMPVDVFRKHQRLACYVSQLPVLDTDDRLLDPNELPTEEIYWLVGASVSPSPRS